MNKVNYDAEMKKIIDGLTERKSLFLHSCCAPCSTRCIEELYPHFDITVVYYNPNIDTDEEYDHRAEEQKRFIKEFATDRPINIVDFGHCSKDFVPVYTGREHLKEGGERCFDCYRLRLEKAASICEKGGYFATTLTLSPLKNSDVINKIGFELAAKYKVNYLPTDFKKRGGFLRSVEMSKEYDLYRQDYCGCVFSKNNR